MIRIQTLLVVSVVSLALLGSRPNCGFAQGPIILDLGNASQDDFYGVSAPDLWAIASKNVTYYGAPLTGHGTTIGVAYQVVRGIDPAQGQWRLVSGLASTVDVVVNYNSGQPVGARLHTSFEGIDPYALGYRPDGWTAGSPSYSAIVSAAIPIRTTGVSDYTPGSIDVTHYMRSLQAHSDASGIFFEPGFVIELSDERIGLNGAHVAFNGLSLDNRDGSAAEPWLPTTSDGSTSHFDSVPSNAWSDPAVASGFDYQMTDGSLFTKIVDFPTGFNSAFTVSVGDTVLGQFSPGQSVDFTAFLGGGVSSFRVSGISPSVDPNDQLAFPLQLQFNNQTASFDMIAVPKPIPGDVNFDGVVNIFDVNLVSAHWGASGPAAHWGESGLGDANGDDAVNIFDINVISSNWTPNGSVAVPEPSAALLAATGLALLLFRGVRWLAVK